MRAARRGSLATAAIALLLTGLASSTAAQPQCNSTNIPPPGAIPGWPQGSTIVVYIDPAMPESFKNATIAAFRNWSRVGGSGVQFVGFIENRELAVAPGPGAVGVRLDDLGALGARMHPTNGPGYLLSARIRVNNRVLDPRTMAELVSHEIGHTFNLYDCEACPLGTSAMAAPWYTINDIGSGRPGPSRCDRLAVNMWNDYPVPPWEEPDDHIDNCYECSIYEICIDEEGLPYICNEILGYCCQYGFLRKPVQPDPSTCIYRNMYDASEEGLCNDRCDAECVRKDNCNGQPCQPDHCWKCPNGPGPLPRLRVPVGVGPTCQDMGWYAAQDSEACQAAAGAPCIRKQMCGDRPCQPFPNYCWKRPEAPPPPPPLPGLTCDAVGWYFEYDTCENACSASCVQKHICGPGPCQPGDCFKCPDAHHSAPNNQPPFAHPGGPYGANVGQGFQLYGTSSGDPDGFLTRYLWTFSGGGTSEGPIINQLYWSPGDHQVWLTVVDNKAKHHTAGTTISISRTNLPPTVSVNGPDSCIVPCTAELSAVGSDLDGDSLIYTWYGCASGSGPTSSCEVTGPQPVVAAVMANDSWGGTAWGWKTIRPSRGNVTVGVFRPSDSHWYLRNANAVGVPDLITGYGAMGDIPVVGDWDGDGTDTLSVFRPSERRWYLRNSNAPGNPDLIFEFGEIGDRPLVGDWDGDGTDTIGVFRPSNNTWYLRNSNSSGAAEITFTWGNGDNTPVVGDWDGDGIDTVGMYRASDSRWRLHLGNADGTGNVTFHFGVAGDRPIVGDWNGDGIDTIGVFRPSESGWYLRNLNSEGAPDVPLFWYGAPSDVPVAGNWDGQ